MKQVVLFLTSINIIFAACTSKSKTNEVPIAPTFDSLEKTEYPSEEINPLKDSVEKLFAFISNEKNSDQFSSWKKYPVKEDTTMVDVVVVLRTKNKTYEIIKEAWSNSLQIKGNYGSQHQYYIADSGPDGHAEAGSWTGYSKGDAKEKLYATGIFAGSDESQICCDHREYWQIKYRNAVRDICSHLKL